MSASTAIQIAPSVETHNATGQEFEKSSTGSKSQNSDSRQMEWNGKRIEHGHDHTDTTAGSGKDKASTEMSKEEEFRINNAFHENSLNLSKSVELTTEGFDKDICKSKLEKKHSDGYFTTVVPTSSEFDPDTCVSLPADLVLNGDTPLQGGCHTTDDDMSKSLSWLTQGKPNSCSVAETSVNNGMKTNSSQSEDCIVQLRNCSGRESLEGPMSQSYTRYISGAFDFLKAAGDKNMGIYSTVKEDCTPCEIQVDAQQQGIHRAVIGSSADDIVRVVKGSDMSEDSGTVLATKSGILSDVIETSNSCGNHGNSDAAVVENDQTGTVSQNTFGDDARPSLSDDQSSSKSVLETPAVMQRDGNNSALHRKTVSENEQSSAQIPDKGVNSESAISAGETDNAPVMRKRSSKRRDNSLKTQDSIEQEDSEDSSDEDSGVYAESHRNSHWIKVEDDGTLTLPGMPYTIEEDVDQSEVDAGISPDISTTDRASKNDDVFSEAIADFQKTHKRTDSVATTASESEFRNKFRFLRKRSVQRNNSQQQFYRMSTKYYEDEMTITMEKDDGHENFGLHILDSHPAVISAVIPGSAAEKSGIEAGQILVSISGINVLAASHAEIINLIQLHSEALTIAVGQSDVCHSRDLQAPVLSGYLTKLASSGLIKLWRKRWFVLRQDNCLYYYKTENDNDPLGAVPLTDYMISKALEINRDFAFKLDKYGARTYYLAAESDESRKMWATAMTAAARSTLKTESWMDVTSHNVGIPALSIRNPECTGYLSKLGEARKVWRKRYCVLKDACIYYYKGISSYSAQGVAHLHGYQVDSDVGCNKKHGFKLIPPEPNMRTFLFATENATDKERWMGLMENSIIRWKRISYSS